MQQNRGEQQEPKKTPSQQDIPSSNTEQQQAHPLEEPIASEPAVQELLKGSEEMKKLAEEEAARAAEIEDLNNYVEEKIIKVLDHEKDRLVTDHEITDENVNKRLDAISDTRTKLKSVMLQIVIRKIPITNKEDIKTQLEKPIKDNLENFDKRKGS